MLHASVQRESLVVAAEGLLKGGGFNAWCMPMASARELCPRIAAKNLVLAFPPAYQNRNLRSMIMHIHVMCIISMAFSPTD